MNKEGRPCIFLLTYSFKIDQGRVAEWLGGGLQNLLQRFESARDLSSCSLARLLIGCHQPRFFSLHSSECRVFL